MILAGLAAILVPVESPRCADSRGRSGVRAILREVPWRSSSAVAASDELKMRRLTGDEIYAALAKGAHIDLQGPTDDEKREIALSIGGRKPGVAEITDAKLMTNHCSSNPPLGELSAKSSWNGWGNDPMSNARFQPAKAAGLTAAQVPQLKLKWAFGFPELTRLWPAYSCRGRVFIGVDSGAVYSIDAATGCVYWSYQADASVRTAINIGPVKGQGAAKEGISFGDVRANVYMLNAATGDLLWKVKVEDHPVARITGAPTLYEGRLYVPVSSTEERAGA